MRLRPSGIALCLTAIAVFVAPSVHAGDVLSRLTSGHQYSLALGTVVSISDATVRFEVETIISGKTLPSVINVEIPDEWVVSNAQGLGPGNHAVFSLKKEAARYTIAWGFFRVSSLDMGTLEIIESTLPPGDVAALQRYINSEGTETDFFFIGTTAYVRRPDGTSKQLYPPTDEPAEGMSSSD